jgi:putative OmpL-like beta-barrel porin-2
MLLAAIPVFAQSPVAGDPPPADASPPQSQSAAPSDPAVGTVPSSADPAAAPSEPKGFWSRLAKAYADDWHAGPDAGPAAPYRGDPSPVSSPPFPFAVWPIGGTVWIGYPNATSYPLTTALQTGPHGDWWKKANIQIYGWADLGANVSTSSARPYGNLPAAYAEVPNTVQLDQATLYIERTPDTVQTDHFDWGFRFTSLYGLDYRFTTAEGYFSQQLLNNPQANGSIGRRLGYDPVMMYLDLYFPKIGKGTDVRIGRYISLPDIEAQLAPNNYTFTHSLTYTYDCYTQTGINATTKWSNHWTTQVGVSGGCEAAPWAPDAKLTLNACVAYTWAQGGDDIYICANSINDSKYNYNNLAAYYATWYHKFGHSKWHMAWESWYQYMKDTPNVSNPAAASLLLTNSNGAVCNNSSELTCFAPEWATLHYLSRQLGRKDALIFRNEYFNDLKGQRTGFKTKYTEHDLAWNHWIGTTVVFRPELRYDYAYDAPAFDAGTKKGQLMLAADVIWFY